MTRALPRAERQAIARDILAQSLPLARKEGYFRVTVLISERGAVSVTAEQAAGAMPDAPLDV